MKFISITPENNNALLFDKIINAGPAFVKIYSPGCGHCVAMQPAWDELKNHPELADNDVAVIEVNADMLKNIKSSVVKNVKGFPTMRAVKNGKIIDDYNGDRTSAAMVKYIKKHFKNTGTVSRGKSIGGKSIGTKRVGGKSRKGRKGRKSRKTRKTRKTRK